MLFISNKGMCRSRASRLTLLSGIYASLFLSQSLFAEGNLSNAEACSVLQGLSISAESINLPTQGASISSAELILANAPDNNNGEYCKVLGSIHAVTGNAPDINFQVNLPSDWNGKSLHFGGGGLNGVVISGLNHHIKQPETQATPLAQGYVTFGSDSGHQSTIRFDGRFFLIGEALRNFGHEQVKKTNDVAKQLIMARYSRPAQYSYFMGGSQGGHEAFDAAQRYAEDYDGIVAGYPAHNLVMLHLSAHQFAKALLANDGDSWLNPAKVEVLTNAVYGRCDALDGAEDGIISNVASCAIATADLKLLRDENPIRCISGNDAGDTCLSDEQIEALNIIDTPFDLGFSIYPDDNGNSIYPKWTPFEGSTFMDGGFPNLGGEGPEQALNYGPAVATPQYAIAQDLTYDVNEFDPLSYAGRIAELGNLISANSVNLEHFRNKGAKLIYFHGWADDFIPVYSSIQYYERLQNRYPQDELDDFVRFYTVPGMGHVTGVFNARISLLKALENWVENGEAPGELLATDANPDSAGRTRPVCIYPEWPQFDGTGNLNDASNFECIAE